MFEQWKHNAIQHCSYACLKRRSQQSVVLGWFSCLLRAGSDSSRLHLQPFQLLSPERKKRVFFAYEKRLRELSSPDKVFDYFASDQDPSGAR